MLLLGRSKQVVSVLAAAFALSLTLSTPGRAAAPNEDAPGGDAASSLANMRITPAGLRLNAPARPPTAEASAAGFYVTLWNHLGRCLDADMTTINRNGTKVQLWDCSDTENQWWWAEEHTSGYWTFQNYQSGRCLDGDVGFSGNGGKVQLWDCDPGHPAQRWWSYGSRQFYNGYSGRCLDADTATGGRNGTKVQVWACAAGNPAAQSWNFY
ncbi:RICIN domain-containing protein [Micromonospora chokoriensis]